MSIKKGRFSLVYSINTISVIHFCARQRNNAHLRESRFSELQRLFAEHTSSFANDMAVPRSFSVHMINKCVFEKKDRKT